MDKDDVLRELEQGIKAGRRNVAFMERLQRMVAEDDVLLRRLADCEHRYPRPNQQGFPPDQCLHCGEWRTQSGRDAPAEP